jgi:integrase
VHVTVREKPNGKHEVRWLEASGRRRGRTFTRERDAIRFAAKTRTVLELGGVVVLDEEIPTLAAFVEEYWRVHAIPNLSANTRATYKRVWVKHVLPRLGDMRLRAITPGVVNLQLVQPMRRAGAGDAVIRKTLGMLQGVFGLAVVHDLVPTNPVRPVRKPPQRRREAKPLWPTLVEAIRAQLGPRDATLVSVLAYAGLRPEEALALRWRDVRVDGLVVERALALGEFRRTKTGHERTVTILAPLAQDLAAWRLASGRPADSALVFPRPDGREWQDHDWRNWRRRVYQPAADVATGRPTAEEAKRDKAAGAAPRDDARVAAVRPARLVRVAADPRGPQRRLRRQPGRPLGRDVPAPLRAAVPRRAAGAVPADQAIRQARGARRDAEVTR